MTTIQIADVNSAWHSNTQTANDDEEKDDRKLFACAMTNIKSDGYKTLPQIRQTTLGFGSHPMIDKRNDKSRTPRRKSKRQYLNNDAVQEARCFASPSVDNLRSDCSKRTTA
jgi:hypothetical protein